MRNIRGGRITLELPDLPPLRKEIRKHEQMQTALADARRRLSELEAQRPQAQQSDRDSFARAILDKGADADDPGRQETLKLEQAIEQARARRDAAEAALDQAESALIQAVDAKRSTLLTGLDKDIANVGDEYRTRVEQLIATRARRDELENLASFLAGFPKTTTQLHTTSRRAPYKKLNGELLGGAELVTILRQDAAPTPPSAVTTVPRTPIPQMVPDAAA